MGRGNLGGAPALAIAALALFAALGGTVYAGKKAKKIDGRTIKAKSMPGNRLAVGSVPGNRLKPGAIPGDRLAPGSLTGAQIDAATLGTVPSAVHASRADSARDAETALNAVYAVTATKVNGYTAGCATGTRPFAGACWEVANSEAAVTATSAALSCANRGGQLPEALALTAFAQQPGIALSAEGEWSGDVTNFSGPDAYAVVIAFAAGDLDFLVSTATRRYRCVHPLVS